jgi:hypothetical protein
MNKMDKFIVQVDAKALMVIGSQYPISVEGVITKRVEMGHRPLGARALLILLVVVVAGRDILGLYMAIWHHRVREGLPL